MQTDAGDVEVHFAGLDLNRARIDFLVETVWSQHCSLLPDVQRESTAIRWDRGFQVLRCVNITVMAGFGDVLDWARKQVASRVPKADLDQRDPDYIREQLPGLWLLASLYFRADVRGLDRIPAEGPVLIVGNHSGGNVPPDTFVFTLAFCSYFGVERPFYQLAHNLVVSAPAAGLLRKFGTVAANHENARLALESGAALLVYPGGDYEVFRPSWERHRSTSADARATSGWPGMPGCRSSRSPASAARRPPVPRPRPVARQAIDGRQAARLKSLPISLALPWGLNISDLAGHIPLPAKIAIEVQEPIDVEDIEAADDDVIHDKVAREPAGRRRSARRRTSIPGDRLSDGDEGRAALGDRRRSRHRVEVRQRPGLLSGVHREPRTLGDRDGGPGGGRSRYTVHWKIGSVPIGGVVEVFEFDQPRDLSWIGISGSRCVDGSGSATATTATRRSFSGWPTNRRADARPDRRPGGGTSGRRGT